MRNAFMPSRIKATDHKLVLAVEGEIISLSPAGAEISDTTSLDELGKTKDGLVSSVTKDLPLD